MTTQDGGALIQRVAALLTHGRQSATYKPALVMALLECCAQRQDLPVDAPVDIPLMDLADAVTRLYWDQVRPLPMARDAGWSRLRQESGERPQLVRQPFQREARIPRAVRELQDRGREHGLTSPDQVRSHLPQLWDRRIGEVAATLAEQPIRRLQEFPTRSPTFSHDTFLYDDTPFAARLSASAVREAVVQLKPGVAWELVSAAPVLRPVIETIWTRRVAEYNSIAWGEDDLRSVLFGSDRRDLSAAAEVLREVEGNRCFWCRRKLTSGQEVDHVIPWSLFANDSLFNLVLTDRGCNSDKTNLLVAPPRLEEWVNRSLPPAGAGEASPWPVDRSRSLATARSAYATLAEGLPVWEARGVLRVSSQELRAEALAILSSAA